MENGSYYNSSWLEAKENSADFSATPSNESCLVMPWPMESRFHGYKCHGYPSTIEGFADDKATAASSSHSQAEKRRRDRINAQLLALRQLIPESEKVFFLVTENTNSCSAMRIIQLIFESEKMDKAALLGSAIEQVKDLKRKVKEISKDSNIPTETDEVTVIDCDVDEEDTTSTTNSTRQNNEKRFIKASICCDDRPRVLAELIRVLKGLRLSTIKADISCVGGRLKSNFILCNDDDECVSSNTLRHSLDVVLSRNASSSSPDSDCRIRSKRQRLLLRSDKFT